MEKPGASSSTFYAPDELLERVQRIQTALQDRIVGGSETGSAPRLSRSYVIRAAMERGLKAMEGELGIAVGGE